MNENVREIFVENLRELMEKHCISQTDIATKFDLTSSTVSDWVKGKKYPRVDKMQMLADLFHVPMSYLVSEHKEIQQQSGILSVEENEFLAIYRDANDNGKKQILYMVQLIGNDPKMKNPIQPTKDVQT